jgi:hypothetical protein
LRRPQNFPFLINFWLFVDFFSIFSLQLVCETISENGSRNVRNRSEDFPRFSHAVQQCNRAVLYFMRSRFDQEVISFIFYDYYPQCFQRSERQRRAMRKELFGQILENDATALDEIPRASTFEYGSAGRHGKAVNRNKLGSLLLLLFVE